MISKWNMVSKYQEDVYHNISSEKAIPLNADSGGDFDELNS